MANRLANRFSKRGCLVAISSRNRETGKQLAGQYSTHFTDKWSDLIQADGLDGIAIATHNNSHGQIAVAALEADKHVYVEYPLSMSIESGKRAIELAAARGKLLRVSHPEPISARHLALKSAVSQLGQIQLSSFLRLTPGRGARPEMLFNLPVSGIPAHFFIYHIYPTVDLFGGAKWVEAASFYEGMSDSGQYQKFVNSLQIEFRSGGIGQWTWAGGITIEQAEQHQRYILTGGTLISADDGWHLSTPTGTKPVPLINLTPKVAPSIEEQWLQDIATENTAQSIADDQVALESIKISLSARMAIEREHRVEIV